MNLVCNSWYRITCHVDDSSNKTEQISISFAFCYLNVCNCIFCLFTSILGPLLIVKLREICRFEERSEFVLTYVDEKFRYCTAGEGGVVVYFHAEIELDFLRSGDASHQDENRLRGSWSTKSEERFSGTINARRCSSIHERHAELHCRAGKMSSSHREEFELASRRDRQHAHERYEVVGKMGRPAETLQVSAWTITRRSNASVSPLVVYVVSRRAVNLVAAEFSSCVLANFAGISANAPGSALVDILASSLVDT